MEKNILNIQQEIRNLNNKIREISYAVSSIYKEINKMGDNIFENNLDYKTVCLLSTHFPFGKHPLNNLKDNDARQIYIEILLSLVQADKGSVATFSRLTIIQWLLTESQLDMKLEELFVETLKISSNTFDRLVKFLPNQYREYLIVDALIVANICGQAEEKILNYIVNLCVVFGINKEQVRILSIIAKGILKQDMGRLKKADLKSVIEYSEKFKHYMDNEAIRKNLFLQRIIVVEVPDSKSLNFKWKIKQQTEVEKGDLIATYKKKNVYNGNILKIIAPCSGTIFQFRDNCINYGVIASAADNKNSIKSWVLEQKNNKKK